MGRTILSVIVGYIVMFVLIFVLFTCAYLALGADGAFRPGSYVPSTTWGVLSVVVSILAAVAGGCVAVSIAKSKKAGTALAVVVLILGIAFAVPALMAPDDPAAAVRTGDVSNLEAMQKAKPPIWAALLNPVIGFLGVLWGASLCGKKYSGQA